MLIASPTSNFSQQSGQVTACADSGKSGTDKVSDAFPVLKTLENMKPVSKPLGQMAMPVPSKPLFNTEDFILPNGTSSSILPFSA